MLFVMFHVFLYAMYLLLTFCESEWKSLDQITTCLALQQPAGHRASLWLAAHVGVLDIRSFGL